jgi:hypothetical protein
MILPLATDQQFSLFFFKTGREHIVGFGGKRENPTTLSSFFPINVLGACASEIQRMQKGGILFPLLKKRVISVEFCSGRLSHVICTKIKVVTSLILN